MAFWVREFYFSLSDHSILLIQIILTKERRAPHDHLIREDADSPPVDGEAVAGV